jgi:hypothetical protein
MVLHIAVAVVVVLLLYYWMNMKPKNFPPGNVHRRKYLPIVDILKGRTY